MTRSEAEKKVTGANGKSAKSVTKDLDYLVVGDEGSPLFGNGKKGSKLVKAEKLQADGSAIKIISETALSFLGLGLRAPAVSWGVLLQESQNVQSIALYPWMMIPAVVAPARDRAG